MTNDVIRRALSQAAPTEPGFEGWGDQIRRKYHRRQTMLAVAAGIGVIALAVPIGLQLLPRDSAPIIAAPPSSSSKPTQSQSLDPTRSVTPAPPQPPDSTVTPSQITVAPKVLSLGLVPSACQGVAGSTTELPGGRLPTGASKLWLCNGEPDRPFPQYGPAEALTVGVDQAVAAFNALPKAKVDDSCVVMEQTPKYYTVLVEYADGKRVALTGVDQGCKQITDGKLNWGPGDKYLQTLWGLWDAQRAAQQYEINLVDPKLCSQVSSLSNTALEQATGSGYLCVGTTTNNPSQRSLPKDLVARFIAEAVANKTPMPATEPYPWTQSLVLVNRYGEPITVYRSNTVFYWQQAGVTYEFEASAKLLADIEQQAKR